MVEGSTNACPGTIALDTLTIGLASEDVPTLAKLTVGLVPANEAFAPTEANPPLETGTDPPGVFLLYAFLV